MKKYYIAKDYTGKKHKIYLPEERINPFTAGGKFDVIPFFLLFAVLIGKGTGVF